MPVTQRQGPKYFPSPKNTNYRNNYESINFKKDKQMEESNKPKDEEVKKKGKPGRPKGSKNKPKDGTAEKSVKESPIKGKDHGIPTDPEHQLTPDHASPLSGENTEVKIVDVPGVSQVAGSTSANPHAGRVVAPPTAVVAVPVPETEEQRLDREADEAEQREFDESQKRRGAQKEAQTRLEAEKHVGDAKSHPHRNPHDSPGKEHQTPDRNPVRDDGTK